MIDELYLYFYANEPNKSPWRERLWALLPLRETATFPPQADHVLVVFFLVRGGTRGAALKPPDSLFLSFFLCACGYFTVITVLPLHGKTFKTTEKLTEW